MICLCVKRTSNVHKDRNLEIRKTRNDVSVQVRNVLLPLSLMVFRHKEIEAQSFYSGFFICSAPSRAAPATRPRELAKANRLVRSLVSTILTFIKFPKSSARFRSVTSFTLASPVSHLGLLRHLWVTRLLCARALTHVLMLHLCNPCTEL